MISAYDREENIVGMGENAGYQHFLLFPQCFQKISFSGLLKVRMVWERVNEMVHVERERVNHDFYQTLGKNW